MNEKAQSLPNIFILVALASFLAYILLAKSLLLHLSIEVLIFLRFVFMAAIDLISLEKSEQKKFQLEHFGIHILMALANLGLYYCFFAALQRLPLISAVAIYLAAPVFVPWVLRVWMGKKFSQKLCFGIYLTWVGILLTFDSTLKFNNILIVLAIASALLKAICFCGTHRLKINHAPLTLWFTQYSTVILCALLLLYKMWVWPSFIQMTSILLLCLLEKSSLKIFKRSIRKSNSLKMIMIFNSSIFLVAALDFLFFRSLSSINALLCAILIYFGLFFTFLQKGLLPNSIHDI